MVNLLPQSFGVAEGRSKDALKNIANAAGQSSRDFTPPGGETVDQVGWGSECDLVCCVMSTSAHQCPLVDMEDTYVSFIEIDCGKCVGNVFQPAKLSLTTVVLC